MAGGRHARQIEDARVGDPFDRPCPDCEGIGQVAANAWLDWVETYRQIEFGIVDPVARLAALADHMRGGPEPPPVAQGSCAQCDGSGRVLTQPGRELVDFLRQRLPDLIERRLNDIYSRTVPPPAAATGDSGDRPPHLYSV